MWECGWALEVGLDFLNGMCCVILSMDCKKLKLSAPLRNIPPFIIVNSLIKTFNYTSVWLCVCVHVHTLHTLSHDIHVEVREQLEELDSPFTMYM